MAIIPISVANGLFGAFLVSGFLKISLWGMSSIQLYSYYTNVTSQKDKRLTKHSVTFAAIINTLHTVLVGHVIYWYTITQYGDPLAIVKPVWSMAAANVVAEILYMVIRLLFARRIWLLSAGKLWGPLIIGMIAIPGFFVDSIPSLIRDISALRCEGVSCGDLSQSDVLWATVLAWVGFAMSVSVEIAITGFMCYYLYTAKGPVNRTNLLIDTLIKYVISTSGLIVATSIIGCTLWALQPMTFYTYLNYFTQCNLYLCCYLAGLNRREDWKDDYNGGDASLHLSQMPSSIFPGPTGEGVSSYMATKPAEILVLQSQCTTSEVMDYSCIKAEH